MAGLVPAIPIIERCAILIEITGTSSAMRPRVLPLLRKIYIRSCRGSAAGREPGIHDHKSGEDGFRARPALRCGAPYMTRLTEHISIKRPASSRAGGAFRS